EAERLSEELHALHDDLTAFDEEDPSASAREQKRAEASLHLEGLIREDYEAQEVKKLIEKIRNGLGHWLTFVTEPDVDSTNNRAERALREQVVLRKMFRTLRSAEGVQIHETITTMLATWKRRGLDPPEQLQSILGGQELRLG
ncbi:transposase, partial [Natrinema hispanicum]